MKQRYFELFDQMEPKHAKAAKAAFDPVFASICPNPKTLGHALANGFRWGATHYGYRKWAIISKQYCNLSEPVA